MFLAGAVQRGLGARLFGAGGVLAQLPQRLLLVVQFGVQRGAGLAQGGDLRRQRLVFGGQPFALGLTADHAAVGVRRPIGHAGAHGAVAVAAHQPLARPQPRLPAV